MRSALMLAAAALALLAGCAAPGQDNHSSHSHPANTATDTRVQVAFPDTLRTHTLANMRDHLQALAEIQDALGRSAFDQASTVAEQRLGMSSLKSHGSHDVAKFMPPGMQAAGAAMHRSASQFAVVAQNASVTGDLKATLAALAKLSNTCVACHAGYRIQ